MKVSVRRLGRVDGPAFEVAITDVVSTELCNMKVLVRGEFTEINEAEVEKLLRVYRAVVDEARKAIERYAEAVERLRTALPGVVIEVDPPDVDLKNIEHKYSESSYCSKNPIYVNLSCSSGER